MKTFESAAQTAINDSAARTTLMQGLRKGWAGSLWMYKILIPVSFLTFLLKVSRVLDRLDGLLGPAMNFMHLPAKAVMPLLAGMLTGIYGGIAAMSVLSFTVKETTLIAVFLLISHGLIQESIIQGKAGMHPLKAAFLRITTSIVVVWFIGLVWQGGNMFNQLSLVAGTHQTAFWPALKAWCLQTVYLSLQIFLILIAIMTVMEWMKSGDLSARMTAWLNPVLRIMGLGRKTGLLWLTAMLFGISYGAAVIVEETRNGKISKDDLEDLHLSIGINHAVIEDPLLFLPLGIHPLWLWIPRLISAFAAVHVIRLVRNLRGLNRNMSYSDER